MMKCVVFTFAVLLLVTAPAMGTPMPFSIADQDGAGWNRFESGCTGAPVITVHPIFADTPSPPDLTTEFPDPGASSPPVFVVAPLDVGVGSEPGLPVVELFRSYDRKLSQSDTPGRGELSRRFIIPEPGLVALFGVTGLLMFKRRFV